MRLVFLLAAEERGLCCSAIPATRPLRAFQLCECSCGRIPKRSSNVAARLGRGCSPCSAASLAASTIRAARLPALGGSLFDPDRYPFLEGAQRDQLADDPAEPLPIDDRTVLLLLEAIQTFEGRTLSYRALDVEQIGHVYEGLLERTVKRVDEVTLELGRCEGQDARVALGEMESARLDGAGVVDALEGTDLALGSAIRNALGRDPR